HPLADLAIAAVHAHHETPDGTGYPLGLSGNQIPVDARIVGICDAFDAMTSNRPYRRGMPVEKALSIIEGNLGGQFDKAFGLKFIEIGRRGHLSGIAGYSEPGIPVQECPMCGPTIVVRKKNLSGDRVYCRHCGAEATVRLENGKVGISMTGEHGDAAALQADADIDMIDSLVSEAAAHIYRKKTGLSRILPFGRSA
ncbi:MAG TPA: HD domain-containing phosphohydrolase, partial [Burkholderiales bacterium]|nr:HD domain-containing phosphohydrolase [Burkholderiales bacterium]